MSNKVCIVGAVAGGASCATRLRRLDERAEIILFERGEYPSFANCGLPYQLGGVIAKRESLLVATPWLLRNRYRIDLRLLQEVVAIDREHREVVVKRLDNGETYRESYDSLVLSPGAEPFKPEVPGLDLPGVFTLRTIPDLDEIKEWISRREGGRAAVIGGGYIGLEAAENLRARGLEVTVFEQMNQLLAPFDFEMAAVVEAHLRQHGVELHLGEALREVKENDGRLSLVTGQGEYDADLVLVAVGVRPETRLAAQAGLELGVTGGIKVDKFLRTSDPNIYAVGDAIETTHLVSGTPVVVPLAGPANRQGRIAADNICGRGSAYLDTQGTSIIKVFQLAAATTGLNARVLERHRIPYRSVIVHPFAHAGYYPGSTQLDLKLLFSPVDGRILGAQCVGQEGVDKRIDVLVAAIRGGMTVYDLEHLELCYAPPFSSAKDPVNIAGFAAANIMRGDVQTITWDRLDSFQAEGGLVLDVRTPKECAQGMIPGAVNIPLDELRDRLEEVPREKKIAVHCAVGLRSYLACRILTGDGYRDIYNLSGGYKTYKLAKAAAAAETPDNDAAPGPSGSAPAGNIKMEAGELDGPRGGCCG